MIYKRLFGLLIILFALANTGFGQEKIQESAKKQEQQKVVVDPPQKRASEQVKVVPITNKNLQMMRKQSQKATTEQMHTINKAMRKSMTIHRRK